MDDVTRLRKSEAKTSGSHPGGWLQPREKKIGDFEN